MGIAQKLCCVAYALACLPFVAFSLMTGLVGRCDSTACLPWPTFLLIFPGLLFASLVGSALMARWAVKEAAE